MDLSERLQNIDRRILYALLAIAISLPLVISVPLPSAAILPRTQSFYDTLGALANSPVGRQKLVIVCTNFSASTAAENLTQTEAILRHLMASHLKFALFCFNDPQGQELGQQVASRLEGEYGYKSGTDYINWGFKTAPVNTIKAMVRDIHTAIGNDYKGRKLTDTDFPIMQGINTVDDIGAIIELSAANSLPIWLQYYQRTGKEPIPTLFACTAVMAPEAFPFLKSGQLQGMLVGLQGAGEYEKLIQYAGFGTRASASLSYAHLLIIALILLGNTAMFLSRRKRRAA